MFTDEQIEWKFRAVDDRGGKKLEIRLGGIYALERIDKESLQRACHGTVMEVLTAYVRENSRESGQAPTADEQAGAPTATEVDNLWEETTP